MLDIHLGFRFILFVVDYIDMVHGLFAYCLDIFLILSNLFNKISLNSFVIQLSSLFSQSLIIIILITKKNTTHMTISYTYHHFLFRWTRLFYFPHFWSCLTFEDLCLICERRKRVVDGEESRDGVFLLSFVLCCCFFLSILTLCLFLFLFYNKRCYVL